MYIVLALLMLVRGFADALMMRASPVARDRRFTGLSAARALQSDLLRARHDHDLLRGDAIRHRLHEFRRAAAARRARCRVSDDEQRQLLADCVGRSADQYQPLPRRVRPDRLAGLSAAQREGVFSWCRGRLLSGCAADIRRRHSLNGSQFRHHDPQDPRAWHELPAHAGLLLDVTGIEPADPGRIPGADRHFGAADARPLHGLPLLHE